MEPIGEVSRHVLPDRTAAGWDGAIVRLSNPFAAHHSDTVQSTLKRFTSPEPILVHGAISGLVSEAAVLQGALVEGGSEDVKWKNCWMVAPGGVLTSGDSGAAVFTRRGSNFLGVYVGTSYFISSNKAVVHYVQDAATLETEIMRGWNCHF